MQKCLWKGKRCTDHADSIDHFVTRRMEGIERKGKQMRANTHRSAFGRLPEQEIIPQIKLYHAD